MIVMNAGIVEQVGRPIEVYDNPASLFVAGFIGSPAMNFLPGRRSRDEVVLANGLRIAIPAELRAAAPEAITVGVRPEHLVAAAGAGPEFRFEVETVEALGADSLVHGRCGDGAIVARVDGHATPEAGTTLAFSAMPGRLYFFDTASGKRLRAAA
jgi:sn-glycerol 3-phosphate transport system ATP-binding protein